MRRRLPPTVLLCLALVVSFVTPAVADGPVGEGDLAAQVLWASRSGNQPWQRGRVAADDVTDFGGFPSVAVNPANGDTWAAYYNDSTHDLMVAHYVTSDGNCGSANSWLCTTVDEAGDVGLYTSIAISPVTGQPGVAYYDATNHQLKYAYVSCGFICLWLTQVVDADKVDAGRYASLAYDATGAAHISYYARVNILIWTFDDVMYAHEIAAGGNCGADSVAGKWQCDIIYASGNAPYTSIALNSSDWPRIAYYENNNDDLMYAWMVGSGGNCGPTSNWSCITIDSGGDVGSFASLSYASGDAEIAYYDSTNGTLKYTKWYTTADYNCGPDLHWQCDAIDDSLGAAAATRISMHVEGDGSASYPYTPVIAYYDSTNAPAHGILRVARRVLLGNCGPTAWIFGHSWQCDTVDDGFTNAEGVGYAAPHNVGIGLGVATNATGLATIVYYDADARDLLVAYQHYASFLPLQLRQLPHP